jgi:hypothetical protein
VPIPTLLWACKNEASILHLKRPTCGFFQLNKLSGYWCPTFILALSCAFLQSSSKSAPCSCIQFFDIFGSRHITHG